MPESTIRVELIDIRKIVPNPLNPRISIEREPLEGMVKTISKVGLLQPISVRPKKGKYEIIQGERRWRASRLAGLKQIPAIVKDVDDHRMMMESMIENVQREDLQPIEKARGLAEVYHLGGFEPPKIQSQLKIIDNALRPERPRKLSEEEKRIKEVADMIGLSYDYQYRLLSQLRLTPEEQERVTELELGYVKIASISSIEKPEIRERVIEIAPELKRAEVKRLSKVVRKAPEPIVEAVLKPKSKVTPTVAERIMELPVGEQTEAIRHVESLRLDEDEAIVYVEAMMVEAPSISQETLEEIQRRREAHERWLQETLQSPEVKERRKWVLNWMRLSDIADALSSTFCPKCGKSAIDHLRFICHPDMTLNEAVRLSVEKIEGKGGQ